MGAGKTTIGIKLSYALRIPMDDTDKMIEARQNRKISDIFATDGEDAFRKMETDLLQELLQKKEKREEEVKNGVRKTMVGAYILSVGGGLPLREENRTLLKQIGKVVFLRAKPETIYERVKHDTTRPLLQCDDPFAKICELMNSRKDKYEAAADVIIDVDDKNFEEILLEIKNSVSK